MILRFWHCICFTVTCVDTCCAQCAPYPPLVLSVLPVLPGWYGRGVTEGRDLSLEGSARQSVYQRDKKTRHRRITVAPVGIAWLPSHIAEPYGSNPPVAPRNPPFRINQRTTPTLSYIPRACHHPRRRRLTPAASASSRHRPQGPIWQPVQTLCACVSSTSSGLSCKISGAICCLDTPVRAKVHALSRLAARLVRTVTLCAGPCPLCPPPCESRQRRAKFRRASPPLRVRSLQGTHWPG